MAERVCPPWVGYFLVNPLRRFWHNPEKILSPFVSNGMTVLDVGPGMGYFTLPMARMVGATGKVVCVDVQAAMLHALRKRAQAAHLDERIVTRTCDAASLCLDEFAGKIDFALAFAVVHEIPDTVNFFAEVGKVLKPGACCLVAEPKGHVSAQQFTETLAIAQQQDIHAVGCPQIAGCHTALLKKG